MYSVLKLEQLCLCIYMCARFHALKLEQMLTIHHSHHYALVHDLLKQ